MPAIRTRHYLWRGVAEYPALIAKRDPHAWPALRGATADYISTAGLSAPMYLGGSSSNMCLQPGAQK
jgi:hypothetical protein